MVTRAQRFTTSESPAGPSSANVERVTTLIIQPLLAWQGIGPYRLSLVYMSNMLYKGLLRNIHDVEIALTESAHVSAKSSFINSPTDIGKASKIDANIHKEYCDFVAMLCDQTMQQDPNWRDRYYATHIDNVLAVALEQENKRHKLKKPVNRRPPPIDVSLANSSRKRRSFGTPSPSEPKAKTRVTESLPTTGTSSAFESPASAMFSNKSCPNSASC